MQVRRHTGLVAMVFVVAACAGVEGSTDVTSSTVDAVSATESLGTTPTTAITIATSTTLHADFFPAADAIAVVLAALDAKNSYDLDRWLDAFEGGERTRVPLYAEQLLMNAKQQWEIIEPCQVTGQTNSGDTAVECVIKDHNEYWGVGGISDTKKQIWLVNPDGLITNNNSFSSENRLAFNSAFHQWLRDTYPDVYNDMGYETISISAPGFESKNPDHMLIAVDYVDEFVAQSDKYPLDPSDQ